MTEPCFHAGVTFVCNDWMGHRPGEWHLHPSNVVGAISAGPVEREILRGRAIWVNYGPGRVAEREPFAAERSDAEVVVEDGLGTSRCFHVTVWVPVSGGRGGDDLVLHAEVEAKVRDAVADLCVNWDEPVGGK